MFGQSTDIDKSCYNPVRCIQNAFLGPPLLCCWVISAVFSVPLILSVLL